MTTQVETRTNELQQEAKVLFSDLKTILMDNIQKVQVDEDYINQARSINQSVGNVIKLAKMQLDLLKFEGRQQKIIGGKNDLERSTGSNA